MRRCNELDSIRLASLSTTAIVSTDTWLLLLLDLVTVGVSGIAAPFFNNFLSKLQYLIKNENAANNLKDITMMALSQSTTIAKDLLETDANDWDEDSQDSFSNYLS